MLIDDSFKDIFVQPDEALIFPASKIAATCKEEGMSINIIKESSIIKSQEAFFGKAVSINVEDIGSGEFQWQAIFATRSEWFYFILFMYLFNALAN